MKIAGRLINFGNTQHITKQNGIQYTDEMNDNNILIKHTEYDYENDRFIRQDTYDEHGNPVENWWFEYNEKGLVEHLKSKHSSYTRTRVDETVGDLSIRTEKFVSETDPKKNYIQEIVRDWNGKMLSFICNGKDLMKENK